jgi:hypothetical protein
VRPATGKTTVTIDYRNSGSSTWHRLKSRATNSAGYWSTTTSLRSGRSYRVRWTAPNGTEHIGPATRAYRAP